MALAISVATIACYTTFGEAKSQTSSAQTGAEQSHAKPPQEAIDAFVTLAEQRKIDRMVLHYRRWETTTEVPVQEQTLRRTAHLEITLRGHMIDKPALMLAKTLANPHWQVKVPQTDKYVDFGLAITCYSEDKEVIRVSISKQPRILSVNGERFKLPPELMYVLMPLLPAMVYDGMFVQIIDEWAPGPWAPGPWLSGKHSRALSDLFMSKRTREEYLEELKWQAEDDLEVKSGKRVSP